MAYNHHSLQTIAAAAAAAAAVSSVTMSALSAKLAALSLLLLTTLLLGLLPFWLTSCLKRRQSSGGGGGGGGRLALSCLQCLGGGVLLATVFAHMLPEVRETLTAELGGEATLPLAELLLCAGLFSIYLMEELGVACAQPGEVRQRERREDRQVEQEDRQVEQEDRQVEQEDRVVYDARLESVLLSPTDRQYGSVSAAPHDECCVNSTWSASTRHGHETATAAAAGAAVNGGRLASFRVLIVTAALSVHSVFEGVAIGLEPSDLSVWLLTAAIATHKSIIAFCLGEQLAATLSNRRRALALLAVFVLASPLGVALGAGLTSDGAGHALPAGILQALAAGTILYVVLFEIIQGERAKPGSGLAKLSAILTGFSFMLLVVCLVREPGEERKKQLKTAAVPGQMHKTKVHTLSPALQPL